MRLAAILSIATLACSHKGAAGHANALDSTRAADSAAVHVHGPTLIAFFPTVTQAQVDSSDDLATVLDDFTFHLGSANDSLTKLGFVVIDRPHGTFLIVDGAGSRQITPALDSADVGYVFIAPGRRDHLAYGVMASLDLVEAARTFLAGKSSVGITTGRPNDR